jgi:uncharacterized coiled-coil DUF342 family protein
MDIKQRIDQLERAITRRDRQIDLLRQEQKGDRAQLEGLRSLLAAPRSELAAMRRTDAIEEVLRVATTELSPSAIREALHAGGRSDKLNEVTATLTHLCRHGRVRNVEGERVYYRP